MDMVLVLNQHSPGWWVGSVDDRWRFHAVHRACDDDDEESQHKARHSCAVAFLDTSVSPPSICSPDKFCLEYDRSEHSRVSVLLLLVSATHGLSSDDMIATSPTDSMLRASTMIHGPA